LKKRKKKKKKKGKKKNRGQIAFLGESPGRWLDQGRRSNRNNQKKGTLGKSAKPATVIFKSHGQEFGGERSITSQSRGGQRGKKKKKWGSQ